MDMDALKSDVLTSQIVEAAMHILNVHGVVIQIPVFRMELALLFIQEDVLHVLLVEMEHALVESVCAPVD